MKIDQITKLQEKCHELSIERLFSTSNRRDRLIALTAGMPTIRADEDRTDGCMSTVRGA
jgi:hypothetical protein